VQSPFSLFLYWQLTSDYLDMACTSLENVKPGLNLRLISENDHSPELTERRLLTGHVRQGSLYFTQLRPHTAYLAELGLSYHGGFFTLLRSTRTFTPPAGKVESAILSETNVKSLPQNLPFVYSPLEKKGRGE
jgi:hypothetical protein